MKMENKLLKKENFVISNKFILKDIFNMGERGSIQAIYVDNKSCRLCFCAFCMILVI